MKKIMDTATVFRGPLVCGVLAASLLCLQSVAQARGSEDASGSVLFGSFLIGAGAILSLDASAYLVVTGIENVADGVSVGLRGVSDGASDAAGFSVLLTGAAASGLSLAVGQTVTAVATSTGHVLVASGKALAFVPNEIGKSLLFHAPVSLR